MLLAGNGHARFMQMANKTASAYAEWSCSVTSCFCLPRVNLLDLTQSHGHSYLMRMPLSLLQWSRIIVIENIDFDQCREKKSLAARVGLGVRARARLIALIFQFDPGNFGPLPSRYIQQLARARAHSPEVTRTDARRASFPANLLILDARTICARLYRSHWTPSTLTRKRRSQMLHRALC